MKIDLTTEGIKNHLKDLNEEFKKELCFAYKGRKIDDVFLEKIKKKVSEKLSDILVDKIFNDNVHIKVSHEGSDKRMIVVDIFIKEVKK
ncbi:MAG: hypothetical protein KAW92_10740 [Candidatus Cloacimonetes bacterium]|nr:hypothetical protein [Candidatus Cloacimonadota bacterium]